MKKIYIGICDDQIIALKQLKNVISKYLFEIEKDSDIALFENGNQVICNSEKLDILFLDIEMPDMDGIKVGEYLYQKKSHCKIIMATGREDRFKEAFKIDAFRFVSKPFIKEEVENALADAIKATIGTDTIKLYEKRISYDIPQREIWYINAYDGYIEAITKKQKLRKDISVTKIEKMLDKKFFFRISRTYLINLMFVEDYGNGVVSVAGFKLNVPRLKKKEFEKRMKEFEINYR